jgi:hypothetical protein
MDLENAATESFAKTLVKTFVLSTTSSAGVFGGMIVAGLAASAVQSRKNKKTKETPSES